MDVCANTPNAKLWLALADDFLSRAQQQVSALNLNVVSAAPPREILILQSKQESASTASSVTTHTKHRRKMLRQKGALVW